MSNLVEGAGRSFEVYGDHIEFNDPGACYSCLVEWSPIDMVELHRPGCERIDTPAGTPPPGQCWECGYINGPLHLAAGICANDGGCRRWGDIQPDYDEEPPDQSPRFEPADDEDTIIDRTNPRFPEDIDLLSFPF